MSRSLDQIRLGVDGDDRDLKWFLKSGKAPEIWCRLVNGLVEVKYYINSFEHIERRDEHPHLQGIGRFKQSWKIVENVLRVLGGQQSHNRQAGGLRLGADQARDGYR